jgi:hypothetical protein
VAQQNKVTRHRRIWDSRLQRLAQRCGFTQSGLGKVDVVNVCASRRRSLRNADGEERKNSEQQSANALHGLLLNLTLECVCFAVPERPGDYNSEAEFC